MSTPSVYPSRRPDGRRGPSRPRLAVDDRTGSAAAIASRAIRIGDDVAEKAIGHRPFTATLTDRTLWGPLQRGRPRHRRDQKVLALSFDCDYQEDTDALDLLCATLASVDVAASIAAIGLLVQADPEPYRRAVDAGHELVNHTWSHPDNPVLNPDREFWHLDEQEMTEEIGRAQDIFESLLGVRPSGFRSPHFKDAHRMLDVLESFSEITYLSTVLKGKTPGGLPYRPSRDPRVLADRSHFVSARDPRANSRLTQLPLTPCPEHRWSPFCSYHTIRRPRLDAQGQGMHGVGQVQALWEEMLDRAEPDSYALVYFDPKDVAADDDSATRFEEMLRNAQSRGWQISTMDHVARTWAVH